MTAGVWFYTICVYKFKRGTNEYYDVYPEAEKICVTRPNSYEYEQRLSDGSAFGLNRDLILKIQIISSIGITFALLGVIGTIVNTRRVGECRWAGGIYTVAIIKTAMATPMSQQVFYSSTVFEDVQFNCPWGLILGIIGCFFTFVSAAGPMDRTAKNVLAENKIYKIKPEFSLFG
uniref:Uncharacterized protein n=1 Tax=Magallana gigas TaxID=29159 RepID=K1RMH5_MAGGI